MKQIDLLLQPQSMASAMFATIEIISLANRMARNLSGDIETSPFGWRTVDALGKPFTLVDPVLGEGRYSAYDAECDERTDVAGKETAGVALVIPPVRASNLAMLSDAICSMNDAKALIRRRYDEGAIIVASGSSVCLAAAAGIMDNKRAVVPLHLYAWFAESFPKVIVDCDENFSLDGRVLCGRVPTYQTSLTLNLLTELGAAELAKRVAKIAVPDVGMLHTMADIVDSGITVDLTDSIVHKASQWMRENLHQRVTLDDIAHATSTTRRTLLRHFERYAKITPHEHLMMLRIERAKLLLITSHQGMLEIANVCGYSDLRAFRRAFRAYAEVSPSDYRSSQRLRPEARRWRANELSRSTG